jgi:hypothetical protein
VSLGDGHKSASQGNGEERDGSRGETRNLWGRKKNLITTITRNQRRRGWQKQNGKLVITLCKRGSCSMSRRSPWDGACRQGEGGCHPLRHHRGRLGHGDKGGTLNKHKCTCFCMCQEVTLEGINQRRWKIAHKSQQASIQVWLEYVLIFFVCATKDSVPIDYTQKQSCVSLPSFRWH